MNEQKRILIAGIGNIFFGDDAFGCEVAQRLAQESWPQGVEVRDFGIRGIDLAYALMEPHQCVILIDAVPRGEAPGTLYVIEPEIDSIDEQPETSVNLWDAHTMNPEKVLRLAKSLGADANGVVLVGCEPTPLDPDGDIQTGLSDPVRGAVEQAGTLVRSLVEERLNANQQNGPASNLVAANFEENRT